MSRETRFRWLARSLVLLLFSLALFCLFLYEISQERKKSLEYRTKNCILYGCCRRWHLDIHDGGPFLRMNFSDLNDSAAASMYISMICKHKRNELNSFSVVKLKSKNSYWIVVQIRTKLRLTFSLACLNRYCGNIKLHNLCVIFFFRRLVDRMMQRNISFCQKISYMNDHNGGRAHANTSTSAHHITASNVIKLWKLMIKILTVWWLFMASDSLLSHSHKYHIPYAYICDQFMMFNSHFCRGDAFLISPHSYWIFFYQDFQFFDESSNSESSCVILTAPVVFFVPKKKVESFLVGQSIDRF